MKLELYWAILVGLMTSVMWAPHILQRIIEMRPYAAFRDPRHDQPTAAPWAQRAIRAHSNAIENFAIFGFLVLALVFLQKGTWLTAAAAQTYFWARLVHYFVYLFAVPWLRTPIYLIGWAAQTVIGLTLLGVF